MKKLWILIGGMLWFSAPVDAADSAALQGSFSEEEHLILTLTDEQMDEVDARRRVTLTKAQLEIARAICASFPKRVGVASPFVVRIPNSRFSLWPDQVTGIWFASNKVAIARESLGGTEGCREFNTTLSDSDAVLVGVGGGYRIGTRGVDRDKLAKCLDKLALKEPEGAEFRIFVLRPPVLEDAEAEAAVERAVRDLMNLCASRDLGCDLGG